MAARARLTSCPPDVVRRRHKRESVQDELLADRYALLWLAGGKDLADPFDQPIGLDR